MYLIVFKWLAAIGSLLGSVRILVLYSRYFSMGYKGLCRIKVLLFGWILPDWFIRFFRYSPNPEAVSIAPADFLFCTADRSL